jgi:ketosteroid isomerase-like protein
MRTPRELKQIAAEAVAQSNRRFADAAARGDARTMASAYTNDADLLPPNAEALRGQVAIERFWRGGIEMGIRGLELETLQLEPADGLAYEIGRYTLCFQKEHGVPVTDEATYVVIHRRQPDGSWQKAVEIFNWTSPLA